MQKILALFVVLATGCGAVFAAKTRPVIVQSTPPDAQVLVDGVPLGTTPTTVPVNNHKNHTVVVRAPGYPDGTCLVNTRVGVVWVVLDIVLTGLIGVVVDAVTGGWSEVDALPCNVNLGGADAPPPPPPGG